MSKNKQYVIFQNSLTGVIVIIILGSILLIRGTKDKSDFQKATGKVVYLDKVYQELPFRHYGKYRYLEIENYPKVFELFVGNESGDFKPKFENIDAIRLGDEITIYCDNSNETDVRINRLVQFIDMGNRPFYIRGSWDKYIAYFTIGTGLLLGLVIFYLKKKEIIV